MTIAHPVWGRTIARAVAVGLCALLSALPAAAGEAPAATLEVGGSAFWDGPFIESAGVGQRATDDGLCRQRTTNYIVCAFGTYSMPAYALWSGNRMGADVPACGAVAPCIDYQIDVGAGGARLRVAVDHPSGRDTMGLELYAPDGRFVTSSSPFAAAFNVEAYADDPAPGVWTARVVLFDVVGSGFRMRARLDPAPGTDSAVRALLPNLQMSPPFEVGFAECQLSETVQFGATRCLRFSLGPNNVGDGPLDLVINDTVGLSGTQYQRIHHSDGSVQERPAGEYAWHAAHGHYHHVATGGFELLRVDDPSTGAMRQVGAGPKQGFCLAEQAIAEWDSFEQDEQWSATGSCTAAVDPPVGVRMGLTRGWGDVYPYYVEGNYVEFGDNPDGIYVIRATSDPLNTILETSDSDNVAYTYLRVTGSVIEVFERGRGTSPWDPAKVIANDGRPPALGVSGARADVAGPVVGQDQWLTAAHTPPPAALGGRPLALAVALTSTCRPVKLFGLVCSAIRVTLSYQRTDGTTAQQYQDVFGNGASAATFLVPGDDVSGSTASYWLTVEQWQATCIFCKQATVRLPAEGSFEVPVTSAGP